MARELLLVVVAMFRYAAGVLPTDPVGTVWTVLALPDRDTFFDAVDQQPARAKGFAAVGGASGAHHRQVADRE